MATPTPTQNPNEVDGKSVGNGSQSKRSAVSGNPNRPIIPGVTKISGTIPIKSIAVGSGPKNVKGARCYAGSEILVDVSDLELYKEIFLLWAGHENKIFHFYPHSVGLGKSGYLSFIIPQDLAGAIGDNNAVFVRLISKSQPQFSGTISHYLVFGKETEEQAKKRKAAEQASGQSSEGKAVTPGPTELMLGAMGDVLGGIAGAALGALKSTTGVSSVGAKTVSQSGTASTTNIKEVSSGGTVDEGGGYSEEIQQEVEETGGGAATSTSEISTGGQTIRESGTAESTTEVSQRGTAETTRTISTGGTVEISGSVGGSSRGVPSAAEGTPLPTGVSTAISGQSSLSSTVQGGGGIIGGGSPGTAGISGRIISSGQTNVGGVVTEQMSATGTQGAGVKGAVEVEGSAKGNLEARTEVKTEVQAGQASASGGAAQTQTPAMAPAASPATSSTGSTAQPASSVSQAGAPEPKLNQGQPESAPTQPAPVQPQPNIGGISPAVAEQKPVASPTGNIPTEEAEKPPAEQPPGEEAAPGEQKAPEEEGAPGKEPEPKPPAGMPVGMEKMKRNDANLGNKLGPKAEEPPSEQQGKPAEEQQPSGQPSKQPEPGEPEGELGPPNPLPPSPQAESTQPEGQPEGQPGRPFDSANGLKQPGMGEPLQGPQAPEAGEGIPGGLPPEGVKGGAPGGLAPAAEQAAANALPEEAAAGAAEGAEAGAELGPEGALAGAALGALARSKAGKEILGKVGGQATSKVWYYGFASACATFFTGLDFMLGAIVMDAYWIFGHRKDPKLFPLKGWQKIATIAANIIPPVLIVLILALIMVAGCNWPTPIKTSVGNSYRLTVIGAFIGDDCKYFDVSNITGSGSNTTPNTPSASTPSNPQNSGGPVTPKGPSS